MNGQQWKDEKQKVDEYPFKQMPVIEATFEGEAPLLISQSQGMIRYVGTITGLYPDPNTQPKEYFQCEEVMGWVDDIRKQIYSNCFIKKVKIKNAETGAEEESADME